MENGVETNMEYTDNEAAFEISKLKKLEEANINAVAGCNKRANAWRIVEQQKQAVLSAIRSDITRLQAGNVWKEAFHSYSSGALDQAMLDLQEFMNTTMQERNITEDEYRLGITKVHDVKLHALRVVKDLEYKIGTVLQQIKERSIENK